MIANGLVRRGDCPKIAWKNGGGTTRTIAVSPPGAGLENFIWRLSIAEITRPGCFSYFAGIERTIAVIEGELGMDIATARTLRLDPASAPFAFNGETNVLAAPINGPVTDLNLMVRRGACTGEMRRVPSGPLFVGGAIAIIVAQEHSELTVNDGAVKMNPGDAYRCRSADFRKATLSHGAFLVELTPT